MLRGSQMTNATSFIPCTDIETRQAMWVGMKYDEQLGVFDVVTISGTFADRYTEDHKPVVFSD